MSRFTVFLLFLLAGCATIERPVAEPFPITARAVTLDAANPDREVLGRLLYWGGIELSASDRRFGGFSSLKWQSGRLYTITDVGDWMVLEPIEREMRLQGVRLIDAGDLKGTDGQALTGTDPGDAEGLTPDGDGWLVSFEHQHKLLRYRRLGDAAVSQIDPQPVFGPLEENRGVETVAARNGRLFLCAERLPTETAANCFIRSERGDEPVAIPAPQTGLDPRTAFPVDADWGKDGTLYILMRSWSGGNDNRVAIVARSPSGKLRLLATFIPPIATDNYEGLALREELGRTFLYIVSDDNFLEYNEPGRPETWQRTLLMKFELVG